MAGADRGDVARVSHLPRVTVLLATYNGRPWLPQQLASILDQDGVAVDVLVSDDLSDDSTWEWLQEQAAVEPRLVLLPRLSTRLGAAGNFYRLLTDVDPHRSGLIALSDQDDVWLPGKLAHQAALVGGGTFDGVSSNVTAFDVHGVRTVVRKDFPQRDFDYLFESPGPGSTFLLSPRLVDLVREVLGRPATAALSLDFHDWLIYVICRARGWPWHISSGSTVDYRQHESNAFGANQGARSALRRLRLVRNQWHRQQACALTAVATQVAPTERQPELRRLQALLASRTPRARLALAARAGHLRRRPRDRFVLAGLVLSGTW